MEETLYDILQEMSINYLVVYFPETSEFSVIKDACQTGYVGKSLNVTYDDRIQPYQGIIKGVYKTEKEASAMIDRCTNADENTLKLLRSDKRCIYPMRKH